MLYHNQVFVPSSIQKKLSFILGKVITLTYSNHANEAAYDDRYGLIVLPKAVVLTDLNQVFEIETDSQGAITKLGMRLPYDNTNDLVVILSVNTQVVRTVWLNRRNDKHRSLDRSKYAEAVA